MNWQTIRLELAHGDNLSKTSPSRAFILQVPVDDGGFIDVAAIERRPARATVRRFWASEADQSGRVECAEGAWLLRCGASRRDGAVFQLARGPLRLGSQLTVRDPQGQALLFRVASVDTLQAAGVAE